MKWKSSQKSMSFIMPNIYWAWPESVYFIELIFQFIQQQRKKKKTSKDMSSY